MPRIFSALLCVYRGACALHQKNRVSAAAGVKAGREIAAKKGFYYGR